MILGGLFKLDGMRAFLWFSNEARRNDEGCCCTGLLEESETMSTLVGGLLNETLAFCSWKLMLMLGC